MYKKQKFKVASVLYNFFYLAKFSINFRVLKLRRNSSIMIFVVVVCYGEIKLKTSLNKIEKRAGFYHFAKPGFPSLL